MEQASKQRSPPTSFLTLPPGSCLVFLSGRTANGARCKANKPSHPQVAFHQGVLLQQ